MLYDYTNIPRGKQMTEKKIPYSFWIGVRKTLKNGAIFLLPSLVAYQTSVPQEYAVVLSAVIYLIKNFIENK